MSHLRRGWYWGSQEFAEKLRGMLGEKMEASRSRAYRRTPQRLSHGLGQAQRWVEQGLKAAGLGRQDFKALPGSDARKVAVGEVS